MFSALITGLIDLRQANRSDSYTRLGVEMILSFWLSGAGTWSAVGLSVFQATGSWSAALTVGFLTGLGVGAGAAYVRFASSKYSKGLGLTVPTVVAQRGDEVANNGTEVQK